MQIKSCHQPPEKPLITSHYLGIKTKLPPRLDLPDLANKNAGCLVKLEFQINSDFFFKFMSHEIFGIRTSMYWTLSKPPTSFLATLYLSSHIGDSLRCSKPRPMGQVRHFLNNRLFLPVAPSTRKAIIPSHPEQLLLSFGVSVHRDSLFQEASLLPPNGLGSFPG